MLEELLLNAGKCGSVEAARKALDGGATCECEDEVRR
jgi:hypothetical protein